MGGRQLVQVLVYQIFPVSGGECGDMLATSNMSVQYPLCRNNVS